MANLNNYQRSVIYIILGGIFLSSLGIGVRLMESADSMQITFYRALSQAVFMTGVVCLRNRSRTIQAFADTGKIGFLAGVMFASASIFLVLALTNTSIANAMFIMSLAPFVSAILAWLFLRERITKKTLVAIVIAVSGVLIMVNGALSTDGLLGMGYALTMVFFYAAFTVCLRGIKNGDSLTASCWGSYIVLVLLGLFYHDLSITQYDLMICLLLGVFQIGLGGLFLVLGSAHVPAAQIALLAMLEIVLSPIWVWLGVNETPTTMTLIGGGFIFVAITYQALSSTSGSKPASTKATA